MTQPFLQLIPDSDDAVFLEDNVILMWREKRNSYAENSYFEKGCRKTARDNHPER